ncbi:hypothetical protein C4571_00625 [Candidatus Parcubacteria bacterium]|nr:MAG: hypothetical protein C4571_00625 [Candidatus Parcubacteria bacterium]
MERYSCIDVQTNAGRTTISRLEKGRRLWLTKGGIWSHFPDEADVFSDPESAEEVVEQLVHNQTAAPVSAR